MPHIYWNSFWKFAFSVATACILLSQFYTVNAQCPQNRFQCGNGSCIPSNWRCDDENDCGDNSDEARCTDRTCPPDHYNCGENDSCIPMMWVCDHDEDCNNGRDESQCHLLTCRTDEFTCADYSKCISTRWVCDREPDCADGSDEANCDESTCAPNYFQCAATQYCIPDSWTCDGDYDCENGSDEANCGTRTLPVCGEGLFRCRNGDCIHDAWKCDGENDCGDGSDEDTSVCPTVACPAHLMTCRDGSCVYGILCDGTVDCVDGSDEQEPCAIPPEDLVCSSNQFMCRDGSCIDQSRHCDEVADCAQGEDESADQNCGAQESCQAGFRYNMATHSCEDINECKEILGVCSHMCTNHNGSFSCRCQDGFQLLNGTYCKALGAPPAVVYVYHHNIRMFNLSTYEDQDLFIELTHPLALDVDVHDRIVFWSDNQDQKIMMGFLDNREPPRAVVEGIFVVDGIGYDWIHNNIYWTDTQTNSINVASRDSGYRKALITEHLDEPRAIAVDPRTGYMFWTDWGASPKIERAGMNGALRQTIIDNSKVEIMWPNGLTIDYHDNMLYWVDARRHILGTSDFIGAEYRIILHDSTVLMHPFHISVFQDEIYWADWDARSVRRVNKFTGEGANDVVTSLVRGTPKSLQIVHSSKQPLVENYCETGRARCSHLCVASPEGHRQLFNYTCMCPDGIEMSSDGFTCSRHTSRPEPSLPTTGSNLIPDVGKTTMKQGRNDISPHVTIEDNKPTTAPGSISSLIWIIIVALLVIFINIVILVLLVWSALWKSVIG